jgi:NAD(P)-dependent dehydrogenase (short-subunit alcohol dehydrogenase family)
MNASKVILISGGTRGIGAETARLLSSSGHRVFVTSRRAGAAAPAPGVRVLALDVTDQASVATCIGAVIESEGRIDGLVNNAGYDLYGAFEETTEAEFTAQLDTNLMGAVRLTRAVLPHMRAQGAGRIVQVSSLGGRVALPMNSAYAASKFGLEGFSAALRLEVKPFGIHVTLVEPPAVATDTLDTSIIEVKNALEPYVARRTAMVQKMRLDGMKSSISMADVAKAILQALSQRNPPLRITVGSQARMVPLMQALMPQARFEALMTRLFP